MSTFFLSLSASVPFVSFNQFLETRNRYRVKGRGGNTWNPGIPSTSSYGMPGIRDGDGRTFIRHDQRPGPPVVLCAQSRKFPAHISTRREGVKGLVKATLVSLVIAKGLMKISPIVFILERAFCGRLCCDENRSGLSILQY